MRGCAAAICAPIFTFLTGFRWKRTLLLSPARMGNTALQKQVSSPRRRPTVEDAAHRSDRFVEPVEALAKPAPELDAVGLVLELHPRPADPEDGAAAADVIEGRRRLCHEAPSLGLL